MLSDIDECIKILERNQKKIGASMVKKGYQKAIRDLKEERERLQELMDKHLSELQRRNPENPDEELLKLKYDVDELCKEEI